MTPNWHWTLKRDKYSVCTKYLLWGWNFGPFCSAITGFCDTRSPKIRNASNDPKLWTQILVRFALQIAVSEIQGRQKSETHRMPPNWTWTLNSQKYPVYTKYVLLRPKFWSGLLYDQPFSRYKVVDKSEISEMYRMTSNWHWNAKSKKILLMP